MPTSHTKIVTWEQRPAIFLDRDGTIIEDVGYPRDPDQVRFLPGAVAALAELQQQGYALIVISNQSGIGRGLISPAEAEQVHERLVSLLQEHGIRLDAAAYCPHAPEANCVCRKPSPELVLRAARERNVDLARSFFVGDKPCDIEAGRRAGCRTILLAGHPSAEGPVETDARAADWPAVLRVIRDMAPGASRKHENTKTRKRAI